MKQVEDTQTKALEYFKSTRHIIVYYEDILKNHTVRHTIVTGKLVLHSSLNHSFV